MKRLLSCLLFWMFLIGCRDTTAMSPLVVTVTPVPAATPVAVSAEPTALPPTAIPSPTETPLPEPTPAPTETALPEPTATLIPMEVEVNPVSDPDTIESTTEQISDILTRLMGPTLGNPLINDQFFLGHYGSKIEIYDASQDPVAQLYSRYSGNSYGSVSSTVLLDDAPLPDIDFAALNPTDLPITTVLHSSGWGVSATGEALLFLAEDEGQLRWMGAIVSYDGFSTPTELEVETLSPEVSELIAQHTQSISQIRPKPEIVLSDESLRLDFANFGWLDEQRYLISVQRVDAESGPNMGHPAVYYVATGEVDVLEDSYFLWSAPSIAPDGAVFYAVNDRPTVWRDGEKRVLATAFVWATAISADANHVGWAEKSDNVDENGNGGVAWVVWDIVSKSGVTVFESDGTIAGGVGGLSLSANGMWAAIEPTTDVPEERGLWVISADGTSKTHLGYNNSGGTWLDDEWLLFTADIFGEKQRHLYNANTSERLHVEFPTIATINPGPRIFTSGVPISLILPEGWQATVPDRQNIHLSGSNAELFLTVFPIDGAPPCPTQASPCGWPIGAYDFDENRTIYNESLSKPIEMMVLDTEGLESSIFWIDRGDEFGISAEGHHIIARMPAAGKSGNGVSRDDTRAAESIIRSIWFDEPQNTRQITDDEINQSDVWWAHDFESPDGNWTAHSYTLGEVPTEPTQYEVERGLSSFATRQLFTLQRAGQVQETVLIDQLEGTGIGVGHYSALAWSDTHLYFSYLPIPHGCGDHLTGSDLWHYDFATGQVRQLANAFGGGVLALSSDSTILASSSANGFWLRDLPTNTLTEYAFDIPENEVQLITWSPDGNFLLLLHSPEGCGYSGRRSSIITIDVESGQFQQVGKIEAGTLTVTEWLDSDTVVFSEALDGSTRRRTLDLQIEDESTLSPDSLRTFTHNDSELYFSVVYPSVLELHQDSHTTYFSWPIEPPVTEEGANPFIFAGEFSSPYSGLPLEEQFALTYYQSVEFTPTLTTKMIGDQQFYITTDLPTRSYQINYIVDAGNRFLVFSLASLDADKDNLSDETKDAIVVLEKMLETLIVKPVNNIYHNNRTILASPNLVAETSMLRGDTITQTLTVRTRDGDVLWTPLLRSTDDPWEFADVNLMHISNDEQFLYYYLGSGYPVECSSDDHTNSAVFRVDLGDGSTYEYEGTEAQVYAISPDSRTLVTTRIEAGVAFVIVRDLQTGRVVRHPIKPSEGRVGISDVIFSADSQEIGIIVTHDGCAENWTNSFSTLHLDNGYMRTIVERDDQLIQFRPFAWQDNFILLRDSNGETRYLDVEFGRIIDTRP